MVMYRILAFGRRILHRSSQRDPQRHIFLELESIRALSLQSIQLALCTRLAQRGWSMEGLDGLGASIEPQCRSRSATYGDEIGKLASRVQRLAWRFAS